MGKKSKPQSPMGMPQQGMPMQPPAGGQAPPPQMMTPSGQGGFAPPRQYGQPPMMPPQAQGHAYGRMGQMNPKFQMRQDKMGMPPPNAAMPMDPYGGDTFKAPPPQANKQSLMAMLQRLRQGAV